MSSETPWHAAFPAPKSVAPSISREEFLQWIREGKQAGKDFVLVDLRRNDYEVFIGESMDTASHIDRCIGWHNPRITEPACPEFISHHSDIIFPCIE
jgi:hypothetical protein